MSTEFVVVLCQLQEPEKKIDVAKRGSQAEARMVMRSLAGKAWQMERRPDLHTFGELILTFERRVTP